ATVVARESGTATSSWRMPGPLNQKETKSLRRGAEGRADRREGGPGRATRRIWSAGRRRDLRVRSGPAPGGVRRGNEGGNRGSAGRRRRECKKPTRAGACERRARDAARARRTFGAEPRRPKASRPHIEERPGRRRRRRRER